MNDLFERMSAEELEAYAQTGALPSWFNGHDGAFIFIGVRRTGRLSAAPQNDGGLDIDNEAPFPLGSPFLGLNVAASGKSYR